MPERSNGKMDACQGLAKVCCTALCITKAAAWGVTIDGKYEMACTKQGVILSELPAFLQHESQDAGGRNIVAQVNS